MVTTGVASASAPTSRGHSRQVSDKKDSPGSLNARRTKSRLKSHAKSRSLGGGGFLLSSARKNTNQPTSSSSSATNVSNSSSYGSQQQHGQQSQNRLEKETTYHDEDTSKDGRSKEAARIASLVMNMKMAQSSNHDHQHHHHHDEPSSPTVGEKPQITNHSAGTVYRTRKCKAKLELQYQMIRNFQYQDLVETHEDDEDHDILDHEPNGVYNPLQTIRNRIYRPTTTSTIGGPANRKDFIWKIPAQELVQDYAWQQRNRHLMRDRKGRLIYGTTAAKQYPQQASDPHSHHQQSSINAYSKSYGDELIQRIKSKLGSRLSDGTTGHQASDSSMSDVSSPQSPRSLSVAEGYNHDKIDRLSPPARNSSELPTSPLREVPIESIRHKSPERTNTNNDLPEVNKKPPRRVSIAAAVTPVDKQASGPAPAPAPVNVDKAKKASNATTAASADCDSTADCAQELRYLDMVFFLSHMQLSRKNLQSRIGIDSYQSDECSRDVSRYSQYGMNNLAPNARKQLVSNQKLVHDVMQDLNSTKAPRLDHVLVESDKLITEVSTTLNLEIRKAAERLDKLEGDSPSPIKYLYKFGYAALEWALIIIMWLVWALVSVVSAGRGFAKFFISAIRWLLWC